jgi:hypothetical protein
MRPPVRRVLRLYNARRVCESLRSPRNRHEKQAERVLTRGASAVIQRLSRGQGAGSAAIVGVR